MKILKRSGAEAAFDINKIIAAVTKANQTVDLKNTLTAEQIQAIGKYVEGVCAALDRALSVEEIQDIVETQIMKAEILFHTIPTASTWAPYTREKAPK